MGLLCRICHRVKWPLLILLSIAGASLLVFLHIEEIKQINHLAQEIVHAAKHEDTLAHEIRTISRRLANISDHHMKLGKDMRRLDSLLQKDRHKVKIFGVSERRQGDNYTEETGNKRVLIHI